MIHAFSWNKDSSNDQLDNNFDLLSLKSEDWIPTAFAYQFLHPILNKHLKSNDLVRTRKCIHTLSHVLHSSRARMQKMTKFQIFHQNLRSKYSLFIISQSRHHFLWDRARSMLKAKCPFEHRRECIPLIWSLPFSLILLPLHRSCRGYKKNWASTSK